MGFFDLNQIFFPQKVISIINVLQLLGISTISTPAAELAERR